MSAAEVHPSAAVDPAAVLGEGVRVGPFCVVGPGVRLGAGCVLQSHCHLQGPMRAGRNNTFFPFVTVGMAPSDKKYQGALTELVMGDDNVLREYANVHRATHEGGATVIGSRNLVMPHAHIAHECTLGDDIVLGNASALGGHVVVGDAAVIGGQVAVHQYSRLGTHCFIGAQSMVRSDVPAWVSAVGNPAVQRGVNQVGMQRAGRTPGQVRAMRRAVRLLYRRDLPLQERLLQIERLAAESGDDGRDLEALVRSVRESSRGLVK